MAVKQKNRRKRSATAKRYGQAMFNGTWRGDSSQVISIARKKSSEKRRYVLDVELTPESIEKLLAEHRVLNGQHRLEGVLCYADMCEAEGKTPKAILQDFCYGVDPTCFAVMDRGLNRTASDVLEISQIEYANEMAIAARLLAIRLEARRIMGTGKIEHEQIMEIVADHPDMAKSADFIMGIQKETYLDGGEEINYPKCSSTISPGYAICLHYLMANDTSIENKKDRLEAANEFWKEFIGHLGEKNSSTSFVRRKIESWKSQVGSINRDVLVDHVVEAWNVWGAKEQMKSPGKNDYPAMEGLDCSEMIEDYEDEESVDV